MNANWLGVAALMIGLYAADKSLANLEAREVRAEAQNHYRDGRNLAAAGKNEAAIAELRRAHSLERTNRDYELALADALLTAGRTDEAEQLVGEILSLNSNDGRANLLMARIRVAQDRFDDSVSFYHRAIYGSWPQGSTVEKTDARLELADQLAKRGRSEELLSELLLLDGGSPSIAKKVAGLYLEAGSALRAQAAYRALIKENPEGADAWTGLGQAELRLGEYGAAHGAFAAELRIHPDDPAAEARVQLANRLAELDPTSRRLGSLEKFRRSQEILDLVETATRECLRNQAVPETLNNLFASAQKLKAEKTSAMPSNERAESRLELAAEIWKARVQACSTKPATEDPLTLLMTKISQ